MRLQKNLKKDEHHPDHCLAHIEKKKAISEKINLEEKAPFFAKLLVNKSSLAYLCQAPYNNFYLGP